MSKVIEFKVEIYQVGVGTTKIEKMYAKSLKRLISSMSKQMKRKWITISYTDGDRLHVVENETVLNFK